MYSGTYKAVCYKCSYEGQETSNRCPVCQFPVILQAESTPPGGRRVEEIFARGSIRDGAPPLPGVHAEKRKAQLLAEARRERATQRGTGRRDSTGRIALPLPDPESTQIRKSRRSSIKVTLLCASAVAAGVVAAAIQSGLL